ncbi:Protein-glutamine gamma-glutamyltransferase [Novipirellula galeiformis]|uniref:Protein-glutamine gamma-glutamyltransferase n=1 Tax=Novipirellula galeiformis TaxID=2528004 RepID=A0A5C6BZG1_9BACT|nr:Protein-glutamine gamma-glutamyltransferase [Novipirellula galeiformis]
MSTIIAPVSKGAEARVDGRVKLFFAILSCLGGMVLASNAETETFALVAIFFSVFGYLFVDWLALFSLPAALAYMAMIASAVYCVSDFIVIDPSSRFWITLDLYRSGDRHLVAVSELLVLVQAILMLQRKTRRVCEQLCVFCLLELIVAAVFNNALSFGILMVPIGLVAAYALALLSGVEPGEGGTEISGMSTSLGGVESWPTQHVAADSVDAAPVTQRGMLPTILWSMIPAVLMIGGTFFYAIPRTTESARMNNEGNALVGFDDVVRLKQFGQMQQNTEVALRVWMTERATEKPYQAINGIYLRGRVLEHYHSHDDKGEATADWSSLPGSTIHDSQRLPLEYFPQRSNDRNFYDAVHVDIDCKAMRSDSLFAIAPYFRTNRQSDVVHRYDRWTIGRRDRAEWEHPPIRYAFGTHAFRDGYQSEWIARSAATEPVSESELAELKNRRYESQRRGLGLDSSDRFRRGYRNRLLRFNEKRMPTVKLLADAIASSMPEHESGPVAIAQRFVEFLSIEGGFEYTLNLNAESSGTVDPIEKFVATDRRGHCQYFASALAMMLRSQGIPARLVVGYHTDDFNELGHYYVARQSHAHAWVEALIDERDIHQVVYGQPKSEEYWLRLDATPGGSNSEGNTQGVNSVIDLAETLWKGYVVDLNTSKASTSGKTKTAMSPIIESRNVLTMVLKGVIDQIQAGQLGGGTLSLRNGFSWPAALFGVILTLGLFGSVRGVSAIRWRARLPRPPQPSRPSLAFYAEALDCLLQCGIRRQPAQTPYEFADVADAELNRFADQTAPNASSDASSPIRLLTDTFYRLRFGKKTASSSTDADVEPQMIEQSLAALKTQVQARLTRPASDKYSNDSSINANATRENAL